MRLGSNRHQQVRQPSGRRLLFLEDPFGHRHAECVGTKMSAQDSANPQNRRTHSATSRQSDISLAHRAVPSVSSA